MDAVQNLWQYVRGRNTTWPSCYNFKCSRLFTVVHETQRTWTWIYTEIINSNISASSSWGTCNTCTNIMCMYECKWLDVIRRHLIGSLVVRALLCVRSIIQIIQGFAFFKKSRVLHKLEHKFMYNQRPWTYTMLLSCTHFDVFLSNASFLRSALSSWFHCDNTILCVKNPPFRPGNIFASTWKSAVN